MASPPEHPHGYHVPAIPASSATRWGVIEVEGVAPSSVAALDIGLREREWRARALCRVMRSGQGAALEHGGESLEVEGLDAVGHEARLARTSKAVALLSE